MKSLIFKFINERPYSGKGKFHFKPVSKIGYKGKVLLPVTLPWDYMFTYDYRFDVEISPMYRQTPIFETDNGPFAAMNYVMFHSNLYNIGESASPIFSVNQDKIPRYESVICPLPIPMDWALMEFNFRVNVTRPHLERGK